MITPVLKWIGGKTKIIDEVLKNIPHRMRTYWEPFVGGGSVLLAVLQSDRKIENFIVSDLNESLINMYLQVQQSPVTVSEHLRALVRSYESLPLDTDVATRKRQPASPEDVGTKNDLYYLQRRVYNSERKDTPEHAARFIFLNRTTFRGLYRVGKGGHFNVGFGYYKSPMFPDEKHIADVSRLISRVLFVCGSYDDVVLRGVQPRDFVYLDPPYVDTYDGYQKEGFDHDKFFEFVRGLPNFCMSNSHTPRVLDAFKDYNLDKVEVYQRCHSKNPGLKATEILVTNAEKYPGKK